MSRKKCQNNNNSFGGRLRSFRESIGMSVVQFSELLGISHPSLSQTENNKTITSAQTISNLVQNTNINVYWLCTGEGDITRGDEKDSLYNKVENEIRRLSNCYPGLWKFLDQIQTTRHPCPQISGHFIML